MESSKLVREGPRLPSPFDVPTAPGCDGWEDMYPRHARFGDDRREFEEDRFWFHVSLHCAEPIYPFDALMLDSAVMALNQASSRLFVVPPSLGLEYRILNGYYYGSPNAVTDQASLDSRAELFTTRGGYYYEHWDALYARWVEKVEAAIRELETLVVPQLPVLEDESVVTQAGGIGSGYALLRAYDSLLESVDRIWQYHMEFLNLGYGAYFVFYELCHRSLPGIADQTIAQMVSGIDVLVLRPDEELKRLARLALEFSVAEQVKAASTDDDLRGSLSASEAGARWLTDYEQTKHPWFNFSNGVGAFYHHHRSWIDDPTLPIATIGSYVERLQAGEDIARPFASLVAERERITEEHRGRLAADARRAFDEQLALCRTVFPYVENHNFYIDHWYFTIFWNKVREFGALLAGRGFLADGEDVFFLRHDEVRAALAELRLDWSSGGAGRARGPRYWPAVVERRKAVYEAMSSWSPPPALGRAPEAVTEPVTVMLFGVTPERIREWVSSEGAQAGELVGFGGSQGVAEGRARVIRRVEQLVELEPGEILVAPSTSTSWTPVFGKLAGAVLDSGGMMCHAAIVAREYGLPAVIGTGSGTERIRTGDRLRVDGTTGVVTILD